MTYSDDQLRLHTIPCKFDNQYRQHCINTDCCKQHPDACHIHTDTKAVNITIPYHNVPEHRSAHIKPSSQLTSGLLLTVSLAATYNPTLTHQTHQTKNLQSNHGPTPTHEPFQACSILMGTPTTPVRIPQPYPFLLMSHYAYELFKFCYQVKHAMPCAQCTLQQPSTAAPHDHATMLTVQCSNHRQQLLLLQLMALVASLSAPAAASQ